MKEVLPVSLTYEWTALPNYRQEVPLKTRVTRAVVELCEPNGNAWAPKMTLSLEKKEGGPLPQLENPNLRGLLLEVKNWIADFLEENPSALR